MVIRLGNDEIIGADLALALGVLPGFDDGFAAGDELAAEQAIRGAHQLRDFRESFVLRFVIGVVIAQLSLLLSWGKWPEVEMIRKNGALGDFNKKGFVE